jgi:hypothetical protein
MPKESELSPSESHKYRADARAAGTLPGQTKPAGHTVVTPPVA